MNSSVTYYRITFTFDDKHYRFLVKYDGLSFEGAGNNGVRIYGRVEFADKIEPGYIEVSGLDSLGIVDVLLFTLDIKKIDSPANGGAMELLDLKSGNVIYGKFALASSED